MEKEEREQLAKALIDAILKNVRIMKSRSCQTALFDDSNEVKEKIDLVDRTLEILRIETRHMENVKMGTFVKL